MSVAPRPSVTQGFPDRDSAQELPPRAEHFDYLDASNRLLYRGIPQTDGTVTYYRPSKKEGGWDKGLKGVFPLVPYRKPELATADPARYVFVCCCEDDADLVASAGEQATCIPSTTFWAESDLAPHVEGLHVVILQSGSDQSRLRAESIAKVAMTTAQVVKIVEPPGIGHRQTLREWLASGWTVDMLVSTAEAEHEFSCLPPDLRVYAAEVVAEREPDEPEVIDRWPQIDKRAFHGVAGEIVWTADPHSEADPVATLVQFLLAFANLVGRRPHWVATATRHYLNMFVAVVGMTGVGRKGTSWDVVRMLLSKLDQEWVAERIQGGLVSGEGLIYHVRNPVISKEAVKDRGRVIGYQDVTTDHGVEDKRLLVIEEELSRVLKACNRENCILSEVLRKAWENGNLGSLAKNCPVKATEAHISIIGHATSADVLQHLSATDSANGFGNRFLWVAARMSKELPDGGNLYQVDWTPIVQKLTRAVESGRSCGVMKRNAKAAEIWRGIYPELNASKPGLLGAILARAAPQTMRLACIYALLDGQQEVGPEHLLAAIAVWEYSVASARLIFGDSHGDPESERLLKALKESPHGLTRTEISKLYGGHKKKQAIAATLSNLLTAGLVHPVKSAPEGGRPAERWLYGRAPK